MIRILVPVLGLSLLASVAPGPASAPDPAASSARRTSSSGSLTAGAARRQPAADIPLVVAHRGASGYRPEHTLAAYELAAAMGADYIEPDLVMTKDGVLVDRHEPEISETTDVADHPEFASRRTTKSLDGKQVTGWFTEDFTLAELKTLRAKERVPALRQHNTLYDGRYEVPTYEEVLRLREELSRRYKREIGIIPEIKHSTYFHAAGLDPERATVALTSKYKLNKRSAPMWIQSFELSNLIALRERYGYKAKSVFLADSSGGPFDLVTKGDSTSYDDLLAPESLTRLARWINGIGPYKERVIPRDAAGNLTSPTTLVADAHAAGLKVVPWTFRNENNWLPTSLRVGSNPSDFGKAIDEIVVYLRTGIDGFFTDQADTGVVARDIFLQDR